MSDERDEKPEEGGLDTSEDTYSEPASEPRAEPGEQKSAEADDAPAPAAEDDDATTDSGADEEGETGETKQPGADPEDAEEIEQERQERLDPENRPEGVEVDNSEREFDPEKGMFKDSEGYEEAEAKFPGAGEQGA